MTKREERVFNVDFLKLREDIESIDTTKVDIIRAIKEVFIKHCKGVDVYYKKLKNAKLDDYIFFYNEFTTEEIIISVVLDKIFTYSSKKMLDVI